ncbi:MAG: hypothetical protein EHM23_24535, partial [Acidobacteria bacterium]
MHQKRRNARPCCALSSNWPRGRLPGDVGMLKSKLRLAGVIVAAVLLVAILLVILVHTPPVRRYALRQVQNQLAAQDIKLDAAGISYNLVDGSATLQGVRLSSVGKPDLPPFVEAGEMDLEVGVFSLVRGMIHIERARLDRVALRWITTESGRTNLPDIPPAQVKEKEGGLPEFLISDLQVDRLSVLVEDRQQQIRVELPESRLRIAGRMPGFNHRIEMALSRPGQVRLENRSIPVDRLSLSGELPGNLGGATISEFALQSASSSVRLSGKLDGLADPQLEFSTEAHLNVPEVARLAELAEPVGGTVTVRADLKGALNKMTVDGRLQGEKLAFRRFSDLALDAGFRWDQSAERLNIDSLNVRSPFGSATGQADVGLTETAGTSSAELELNGLDLRRLLATVGSSFSLSSRAAGDVQARWQGLEIENATGEAHLNLAATARQASRNALPLSGRLSVALQRGAPLEQDGQRLREGVVNLDGIRLPGLDTSGRLTLASLRDLTTEPKADLRGQISATVTDLGVLLKNLEAFNGTPPTSSLEELRLRGTAGLVGSLAGTLDRPVLSVNLDAPSVGVADFDGIRLSAEAEITPQVVRISKTVGSWKGQSAVVEGTVNLASASPVLELRSTVTAGDFAEILTALGQSVPIRGHGQVVAAVQGTVANPEARFSAEVSGLEAYEESLGTLTVEGSLADNVVSIKEMVLKKPATGEAPAGTLTATGSYQLESGAYQVRLASQNLRISDLSLPGSIPVSGELNLAADGAGTIADPRLNFTLEGADLKVRDRLIGLAKVAGQVQNRQAQVNLEAPSLNLIGNARVAIDPPYRAEVEIRTDRLDLSKLPVAFEGKPLDGSFTAQLTARGDAQAPMDGQASLRVADVSLRLSGQLIDNQEPFQIDYASRRLRTSPITLASGASYLTIEGELPVAANGQSLPSQPASPAPGFSVKATVDLSQVANIFLPSSGYSAAGSLRLDGLVTGDIPNINPTLRLSLVDGTFRVPQLAAPVEQTALNVSLANGSVVVERLAARLGPGTLELSGSVPLGILPVSLPASIPRSQGPADLRGTLSGFSLQSISGLPEDVAGTLTAGLQAQSSGTDLESITASVRLEQLNLTVAGIALEQEIPGLLTLQNGQARVERFALVGPETRIEAGGTARLLEPQILDLRASGRMDLSLLTVFAQDVAAAGASEFQVSLGGTPTDVHAAGFWSLEKGQLTVQEPGLQLTDLSVRLDLLGNRVVVSRFDGNLNGGSVKLGGEAGFAKGQLESIDLRLTGRSVFLEFPEGLQTASNADLRVASQGGGPIDLSGRIEVLEGSYTDPVNLEEELLGLAAAPSESGVSEERDPFLSRIRFNVNVSSRDPIVMDNNLAKLAG